MKRRKKNLYWGFGPASKAERKRQRSYVRTGGVGRAAPGNESSALRNEVAEALVGEGFKKTDAKKAAQRASGNNFDSLFRSAIGGLKKNPRGTTMATKKRRAKKRKRNSRKGKMPAGLKAYWAKRRAKKNGTKKRRRARKLNPRKRARRRKPVSLRVKNFRRAPRKTRVRRRRTSNPRPRRTVRIHAPYGLGPKGLKQFRSAIARASGLRTRIVSK